MVGVGGQENPRLYLTATSDSVFAFGQHGPELTVRRIHLVGNARLGTDGELEQGVGISFDQCRASQIAHKPDPAPDRVDPHFFIRPSALDRPIRNIGVASGLYAHRQRADDVAWEWRIQGSE